MEQELNWVTARNKFNEEEAMLLDENGKVLTVGDDYHNQIFSHIEGFVAGYEYATGNKISMYDEEDFVHEAFRSQYN